MEAVRAVEYGLTGFFPAMKNSIRKKGYHDIAESGLLSPPRAHRRSRSMAIRCGQCYHGETVGKQQGSEVQSREFFSEPWTYVQNLLNH